MRGFGLHIEIQRPAIDHQIAIADPQMKFITGKLKRPRKIADQLFRLGVGDSTGGVILHNPIDHRHEIAAENPVGGRQRDISGGGFQRRATGVIDSRVVPQQAHRRHIAAALETLRHGAGRALSAFHGDAIHVRGVRGFQRRLAAQFRKGFIGGTVGNDDGIFHVSIR